jgi:hypothetical protein
MISSIFIFSAFVHLDAQDVIYLLNGDVIEVNIKSIVGKQIQYTPIDQPDGKTLRITKTDVDHLEKADGTKIWYNRLSREPVAPKPSKNTPANSPTKVGRTITAQQLNDKRTKLLHTINYHILGGIVIPDNDAYSFGTGYALGLEYTNYFNDHIGFIGHVSGTINDIDYREDGRNITDQLLNTWLMFGTEIGTGVWLNSNRIYSHLMIGGNYLTPLDGAHQIGNSINLAASAGGGIILKDRINLGMRYHVAHQKMGAFDHSKRALSSYLLFSIGFQVR